MRMLSGSELTESNLIEDFEGGGLEWDYKLVIRGSATGALEKNLKLKVPKSRQIFRLLCVPTGQPSSTNSWSLQARDRLNRQAEIVFSIWCQTIFVLTSDFLFSWMLMHYNITLTALHIAENYCLFPAAEYNCSNRPFLSTGLNQESNLKKKTTHEPSLSGSQSSLCGSLVHKQLKVELL